MITGGKKNPLPGVIKGDIVMIRFRTLLAILAIALTLVGCASAPTPRPIYASAVPPLESGSSRLKITSGKWNWTRLWAVGQVGPVFINDQQIWLAAKDEYIIVDLSPGIYELSWTPGEAYKNFTEKRKVVFQAGEIRHFACDMTEKGAGMYFGLIGVLVSEYLTKTYLEEREMDNPDSTLVAYEKFNGAQNSPNSTADKIEKSTPPPISKSEELSKDDNSVHTRLEKLKGLYDKKLITEDEYDKKRKELLDSL